MTREQVTRTIPRKWGPILAVLAVLVLVGTALAVHNDGYFELDGNATSAADDGAPFGANDGEDWDKVCPAGTPAGAASAGCLGGSTATAKFWTADDNRIYTGGSTKDDLDVSGWLHTTGSVPDKDELLHGMAARYGDHLYFGADRLANNGDAQMGVWFFQSAVGPITSGVNAGKFSGSHIDGDILVLSDFTKGGTQPTIRVFRWNGPGGAIAGSGLINGTLDLLAGTATDIKDCQGASLPSDDPFCATVNSGVVGSPWSFVPKTGAAGSFQKGEFYEGGIDLAFLHLEDECFSSVILETRSSQSVDAVLKDFVAGGFESCGAAISIGPDAVNPVNASHTFTVTVTKKVAGVTTGVSGVNPSVTLTASNGATITNANTSDCTSGTGTDADGNCTVTFTSSTAGIVTGTASATVVIGSSSFAVSTDGQAGNSGPAVKRFVDAQIDLSPLTATNIVGQVHEVTATVQQNDGLAANVGGGDATTGFGPAPTGTVVSFSLNDNTAGAAFVGGVASCTITNSLGTCKVSINTTTAGSVDIHATTTFSVSAQSLTRQTDGQGNNSADANKVYVDAQIDLSPLTATNQVNEAHVITATVQQDDGLATGGDGVDGWKVAPNSTVVTFSLNDNTAGATFVGGVTSCTITNGLGTCSVSINTSTAGSVDIHATTTFDVGGLSVTRQTNGVGNNSADANKVYVDARIRLSPLTDTNPVGAPHTVTVTVARDLGLGLVVAPDGHVGYTLTPEFGVSAVVDTTASTCDDAGDNLDDTTGTCTIVFTSASAGKVTINATVTLIVSGETITRDTDPATATVGAGPGGTGPATKVFVDANIALSPLSDTNAVGDPHTITVTVKRNVGLGGGFVVAPDGHVSYSISQEFGANPVVNLTASSCDDAGDNLADATGTCTIVFTSASAGKVTINASVTLDVSGESLTRDTDPATPTVGAGPDGSASATKVFVDANIALSPLTDTNAIGEAHTVTVTVQRNLGLGGGFVVAPDGHVDVTLTNDATSAYIINAAASTCDDAGDNLADATGTCVIVFTSNNAGTVTVNASVALTVSAQNIVRDTDPSTATTAGPGGTGPATKVFKSGVLRWLKYGPDGITLLGGAVFEVCRTHTYNTATDVMDNTVDVCVGTAAAVDDPTRIADDESVPGGTGPNADNDPTGGEFELSSLVLGRYTIRETNPPTGYALDTDTETVDLTTSNPSNADATAGDVVPSFVNPQLFRIIVITCNDSDDTLVDSTVVIDGVTYQTITAAPSGFTQGQICGIGGATKGDLPATTNVAVSVELPDRAPLFNPS
ncbi:MAG TPA: SpaA isopeptide-forming pilin-related protein [Patescibacteria group bacterium]|nr:SpaA isopeptide-forming pilin-related protein [Patescibacteria group bacterium]